MKRPARLAATLALILVGGCEALVPVETELADTGVEVPADWSSVSDSPGVRQGWLSDFEQSPLPALVEEAVSVNYDLRAAAARVAQARARARIVGANRQPQIDAGLGVSRSGLSTGGGRSLTVDSFGANVAASWELDVWGRLANDTLAAARDADAVAADYDAARLSLAAGVAQAWFDAVESELQVALAEETVRNFRDNLEIVSEGFRIGISDALDVRLERANLAGAESELEASRLARDRAVRGLEVLLGRYPAGELAIATSLPGIETEVPAGLPAALLMRRPDVRAAVLRLEASDERLNSARKNRLPDIRLTANGGVSSNALRNLLDFDALVWSVAADLALPIFQGGRLDAERELARAEVEEVLADYAQAVLVAFREVEVALTAERFLVRQESALRVAARESQEAELLALERYRAGLVEFITWLEARRRAFNAKSTLIVVSNRRLQNRIALYLALGGDFTAAPASATAAPATKGAVLARTAAPQSGAGARRQP